MLAASNTSVRNSTAPPIPAGSPASVQRSPKGKCQVHAGGVGVRRQRRDLRRSPKANPAAGSLSCREVLPGQHHLDQRMMGQASGWG